MPRYIVREGERIQHDNKEYTGGDVFACTEAQAKLLRVDPADGTASEKKKLSAAEAIAAIGECKTADEVKEFFKNEERPSVIDAARAKIKAIKDAEK